MFQIIYFTCVYRGHNSLADALSKEAQQVGAGRISKWYPDSVKLHCLLRFYHVASTDM